MNSTNFNWRKFLQTHQTKLKNKRKVYIYNCYLTSSVESFDLIIRQTYVEINKSSAFGL